jgi:hypothetical protein
MIGRSAGTRKLCVSYDVESYSGRGTRREFAIQARLVELLNYAFREAGSPPDADEIQEQGDGGIAFLPTGGEVDEPRLIVGLINALRTGLVELNEDIVGTAQIRLRVALHQGVIHRAAHGYVGPAVVDTCRLRDAEVVRSALARAAAPLVVVVSDSLYQDVLSQGYHGLPASAFAQVDVQAKNYRATGWLYVPGGEHANRRTANEELPSGAGPASAPPAEDQELRSGVDPASGSVLDGFLNSQPDTW